MKTKNADLKLIADWVREKAVSLKTVNPEIAGEDLDAFGKMVGDAKIVGLGEGTHGTSEFFSVKHRLIKYLVEKKGFNTIAFEGNFAALKPVDDYIQNGTGTPEEAVNSISSWVWNTEEVLALVKWMRKYNQDPAHIRKISIYGVDVLNIYPELFEAFKYIDKTNVESGKTFRQPFVSLKINLTEVEKYQRFDGLYSRLSQPEAFRLSAAVEQMMDYLDENRTELISKTTQKEWETARQHTFVALQRAYNLVHLSHWFSSLGQTEELALQARVKTGAPLLLSFFEKHDPAFAERIRPLFGYFDQMSRMRKHYRNELTPERRSEWEAIAASVTARLQVRRLHYLSAVSENDLARTIDQAEDVQALINTFREYLSKPERWWSDPRDVALANNAEWIFRNAGADAKMIVWAHNMHVSKEYNENVLGPMGNELQRKFGKDYITVGTMFNKGEFQAALNPSPPADSPQKQIQRFEVGDANPESVETAFAKTGIQQFILDLRQIPKKGAVAAWFNKKQTARQIGNNFAPEREADFYMQTFLPKQQDIIIFINATTRAKPTEWALENFSIAPPE